MGESGSFFDVSPKLSVVIPAYNRPEALRKVLDALGEQTLAASEYEVIVVIDGGHPEVVTAVKESCWPFRLRWFVRPHQGETFARNFGLKQAAGEFIVSMDDDSIATPEFLERHLARLASAARVVICGDVRRHPDSPQMNAANIYDWSEGYHDRITAAGYQPCHIDLPDNNFSIRKCDLVQVGGWDEELKGYGGIDDWELGYRLEKAGFHFEFAADALVYHYYCKSLQSILQHNRVIGRAQLYYFQKHPEAVRDLMFPMFVRGSDWKRWLLLASRYVPGPILDIIADQIAPLLDRWKLIGSGPASRLFVNFLRGLFLGRGFWDCPAVMREAYRSLRTSVPVVVATLDPGHLEGAAEVLRFAFEELTRRGYHPISIAQFVAWRERLTPLPQKPLLLMFEGDLAVMTGAVVPLLNNYGFHATYLWDATASRTDSFRDELSKLLAGGIDIESKVDLSKQSGQVTGAEIDRIIGSAREDLSKLCGRRARFLAYQTGDQDFEILSRLSASEWGAALHSGDGVNDFGTPQHALHTVGLSALLGSRSGRSQRQARSRSSTLARWSAHWAGMKRPTHMFETEEFYRSYAGELAPLLGDIEGKRVLELGCGNGAIYPYLGLQNSDYTGLDFSHSMLAEFRSVQPHIQLLYGEASSFWNDRRRFDLIFSSALVQHFDKNMLNSHLHNSRRMLTATGKVVIGLILLRDRRLRWYAGAYSSEGRYSWTLLARWFVSRIPGGDPMGHWYLLEEVRSLAQRNGFNVEFTDSEIYPFAAHAVLRPA